MGGSIPGLSSGLSGLGNILSGIGGATGGGSGGGGGSAGGTNPNNPNQPNQQQYNFLTDPQVLAQFAMDQGQNPPQQQPPTPPQPTFSDTNFFSPQQTMPYTGQRPATNPFTVQPQQPAQPAQQGPSGYYGGGQQTQATTAPAPVEIPSEQPQAPAGYYGGGQQTQETPAPAPTSIEAPTAPVGNAPTTGGGTGATGGGTNIAKTGADVARRIGKGISGTGQSYYPDIAGGARESGAGAPNAFTPQAGGQPVNPLQAISNFLNQAFGGGLQAMNQQAGPAYGTTPPPTPAQAQATPGSATSNAPATAAAQQANAMAPGSAAAAVVAGARGATAASGQAGAAERPPLVLRDPSDPSKGYMPDPNYARPGSTGEAQSHTGGPPGDRPAPGNANQSQNYIQEHGGYSQSGYGLKRGNFGNVALNPEFSNRLTNAGKAYEQETGRKPQYGLGDRDIATQQYYWDDSRHGTRYAAAPPGRSLHQRGLAMDMPPNSDFTHWLLANNGANAHRFGLSNPVPHDTFHVQMQDLRGRSYPYAAAPAEDNFHTAGGQQAATEPVGPGVIPGSQQPAGTRPTDVNYQPRDYQRALFQIEGGGNINAPSTGSNRGIAQFSRDQERKFGITNRRDINQEARGVQKEADENTQHLQQAGVAADPANLYLLHQQGQAGGTALLQADANTPAYQAIRKFYGSDAIAQRAIRGNIPSNNPLHNVPADQITAGQFRDMWRTRFEEQMNRGQQSQVTRMPIQLAGDINPDIARMVEQRNEELARDRRRNAILAGRPTIEEGSTRPKGSHLPSNRPFHPTDIDEFIHRNIGSLVNAVPIGRIFGGLRSAVQPTTVGRDEDVR